ncbi:MAG: hypothetical protein WC124_02010 [Desulfoplanes sp.]
MSFIESDCSDYSEYEEMPIYPKIYHDVAIHYPCSTEDLFRAVPFAPEEIIVQAASMLGQGMLWWQVATVFRGKYGVI